MVASVGGPQQLGGPGQWPVWPVVKTALHLPIALNFEVHSYFHHVWTQLFECDVVARHFHFWAL